MTASEAKGARRAVRLVITGKVQGVWFRAWMVEEARARSLDGWVRNRADGSVEALVAGEAKAIDSMIEACHAGPPSARVAKVAVSPAEAPERSGFFQKGRD